MMLEKQWWCVWSMEDLSLSLCPRFDSLAPFFSLSGICVQHIRCSGDKDDTLNSRGYPISKTGKSSCSSSQPKASLILKSSIVNVRSPLNQTKPNRANTLWYFTFLF